MTIIGELAENMKRLKADDILFKIFGSSEIKEVMIEMNQSQLKEDGKASTGQKLRTDTAKEQGEEYYSFFTTRLKIAFGKDFRPVALYDSGLFHDSIKVFEQKTQVVFQANFNKGGGHIWDNFTTTWSSEREFENAILGLSTEHFVILIDKYIYPMFVQEVENGMLR